MLSKRSSSTNSESVPTTKVTRTKSSLDFSNSNDEDDLGFCRDEEHRYVEYTNDEYNQMVKRANENIAFLGLSKKQPKDGTKKRGRPKRTSDRFKPKAGKKEKPANAKRVGRPARNSARFVPKDEREEQRANEEVFCAREKNKDSTKTLKSLRSIANKPEYNIDKLTSSPKKPCKKYTNTYYRSDTKKGQKIGNVPIPEEVEDANEYNPNDESLKPDFLATPARLVAMTPDNQSQTYYNVQYLANILVEIGVIESLNELSWIIIKSAQLFYNYDHHFVPAITDTLIIINQSICHISQIEDTKPRIENF